MEIPKNYAPKNIPKNNEPENPGRRGFIRGMLGGAVAGALAITGANKYMEKEKAINEFRDYFRGKEEDFVKANEASNMLIQEMNIAGLQRVKLLSGPGTSTQRIDVLRDFLTRHLNSIVGGKYYCREKILSDGYYTSENLIMLLNESLFRINQGNYKSAPPLNTNPPINVYPPLNPQDAPKNNQKPTTSKNFPYSNKLSS